MMNRRSVVFSALLMGSLVASSAHGEETASPLLMMMRAALSSETGTAKETYNQRYPWVQSLTAPLRSSGKVILTATVARRLREPGCGIVKMNISVTDVPRKDGKGLLPLLDAVNLHKGVCVSGDDPIEVQEDPNLPDAIAKAQAGKVIIPLIVEKNQ